MLAETQMRLYEIADELNLKDPFYFSHLFKKKTGMSPNQYRRKTRNFQEDQPAGNHAMASNPPPCSSEKSQNIT